MSTVHESIVSKNANTQIHRRLLSAFIQETTRYEGKPFKPNMFKGDDLAEMAWTNLQDALEEIYGPFNTESPVYIEKFANRRVDRVNLTQSRQQLANLEESIHVMDTLETLDYSAIDSAFDTLTKARKAYDDAKSEMTNQDREGFSIFVSSGTMRN